MDDEPAKEKTEKEDEERRRKREREKGSEDKNQGERSDRLLEGRSRHSKRQPPSTSPPGFLVSILGESVGPERAHDMRIGMIQGRCEDRAGSGG